MGGALAALGEKFQQAKDMTDMTESETLMLAQLEQLKSNYADDVDYSTMLGRWSKDADKIPDAFNKNVSGRVKKARESLFLKYRLQYAVEINDTARGLQISKGRAKHDEGLDMILRTGGKFAPDRAEALIRGTAAAGYISAEEAQRDKARILPEIAWHSALDMIKARPEDIEEIITLHPDLELSMKDRLRGTAGDIIAQKQLAVEQEYWQLLRGGRLGELQARIDDPASPLPISRKSWWTEQVKNHITGGDHDPAVYWPLLRKAMKYPGKVTEDEIAGKVGKGINTDDYKEIMRLVEKEGPLQTPRAQIYFGELDALFKNGVLTPLEYDTKNQKLTEFFEANPDATAKQASEFFEESIREEKESFIWNLLTKSFGKWKKSPYGAPYRWLTEEPEVGPETLKEFEDNVRSIAATDEDRAKDYYNKWADKWR